MSQDPLEHIANLLLSKSNVKQVAYRNVCHAFKGLKKEAFKVIEAINSKTEKLDDDISISVNEVNDQEFHMKIAGDLLIFFLHTNVVVLNDDYAYNKSDYVKENVARKYLGQINIYNFMADSVKFNRLKDPGYLLARLLVNHENHFIIEGDRQIKFLFQPVSPEPIREVDLNIMIKLIIAQAIEKDLVAPPFQKIRAINLQQKMSKTEVLGAGNKIGFQMSYRGDIK